MKVLERANSFELHETAKRLGVSPEQFAIMSIEEKLAQLDDEFRRAAEYALQKNADLYRRLA